MRDTRVGGENALVDVNSVRVLAAGGPCDGDLFVLQVEDDVLLSHEGRSQNGLTASSVDAHTLEASPLVEVFAWKPLHSLVSDHQEERREA